MLDNAQDLTTLVRADEGQVSRRIFTDPEIHRLELERIFARTWVYVAHESELPNPGDYVTRTIGIDPVIVARAEDHSIGVFLNACRHRGMRVCRTDVGNTAHFRCPYHGWTYTNTGDLIGVPALSYAYNRQLDRSKLGLTRPPHVESFHGAIFVNWDPDAPSLQEFLGDMAWYLEILFARTPGGMQSVGAPQRSEIRMNWKFGAENYAGDGYHTAVTHRHAIELGLFGGGTMLGHCIHTDQGHSLRIQKFKPEMGLPRQFAWPEEIKDLLLLTPEQLSVIDEVTVMHGNVFPNLSFVEGLMTSTGDPGPPVSLLNVRQWQPTSALTTELLSWVLVPEEAPAWWREASVVSFIRTQGLSGTFDQDDLEIWSHQTDTSRGVIGQRQTFNYEMALVKTEPDGSWPGPGVAYASDYHEANQLAFYRRWQRAMEQGTQAEVAP